MTQTVINGDTLNKDGLRDFISEQLPPNQFKDRIITCAELDRIPDPRPLVKNLLWLDQLAVIGGPPGSFKSFMALHMGLCIATGAEIYGRRTRHGRVVYVVAEGASGFKKRVKAWRVHHGVDEAPNFKVLPMPVDLSPWPVDDTRYAKTIANPAPLRLAEEILRICPDEPPVLVVFDTLARCAVGINENTSQDMGRVVEALDGMREHFRMLYPTQTPPCLLAVHHTPKSGGTLRGSNSLEGATDSITMMQEKESGDIEWSNPRAKDEAKAMPDYFEFRRMVLGQDEWGDDVTSGVLVQISEMQHNIRTLTSAEAGAQAFLLKSWSSFEATGLSGRKQMMETAGIDPDVRELAKAATEAIGLLVASGLLERVGKPNAGVLKRGADAFKLWHEQQVQEAAKDSI